MIERANKFSQLKCIGTTGVHLTFTVFRMRLKPCYNEKVIGLEISQYAAQLTLHTIYHYMPNSHECMGVNEEALELWIVYKKTIF